MSRLDNIRQLAVCREKCIFGLAASVRPNRTFGPERFGSVRPKGRFAH